MGKYTLRSLLPAAAVLAVLSSQVAMAASQTTNTPARQELAWVESDGLRYEIYTSSYDANGWSDPVKITDDNENNLHPSLAVGADGTRWLTWTALGDSSITVRFATQKDGVWQEPQSLPTEMSSALTPSITVDGGNVVWVVWSGNDGADDEIYFSRMINGAWEAPQLVHAANGVPDIRPLLTVDAQGNPQVTWEGFRGEGYVTLRATWNGTAWSQEQQLTTDEVTAAQTEQSATDIPLPEFVSGGEQVFRRIIEK